MKIHIKDHNFSHFFQVYPRMTNFHSYNMCKLYMCHMALMLIQIFILVSRKMNSEITLIFMFEFGSSVYKPRIIIQSSLSAIEKRLKT